MWPAVAFVVARLLPSVEHHELRCDCTCRCEAEDTTVRDAPPLALLGKQLERCGPEHLRSVAVCPEVQCPSFPRCEVCESPPSAFWVLVAVACIFIFGLVAGRATVSAPRIGNHLALEGPTTKAKEEEKSDTIAVTPTIRYGSR